MVTIAWDTFVCPLKVLHGNSTYVCCSVAKLNLIYKYEKTQYISKGSSCIMSNPHPRSEPGVMVTEATLLCEPISGVRDPSLNRLGAGARHHIWNTFGKKE